METALITGASGGIGYELAKIFAKNGINLILVARSENKLQELAKELSQFNLSVGLYCKDLSKLENAEFIYNDLQQKGIQIDYLVNNAGFGIDELFIDIPWQRELEMYQLNMITLSYFTKVFANDMVKRKSGNILNIASTASFQPTPYMAGYGATKAFVLNLSQAINFELKGTNVSISTLCPGSTDTHFHAVANSEKSLISKMGMSTAESVAKYGFKLITRRKSMGVHGILNKLTVTSIRLTSRNLVIAIAGFLLKKK